MILPKHSVLSLVLVLLVAIAGVAVPDPAHGVGGEGESWPTFNESGGCGSPRSIGPNADTKGPLGPDTVLRGPEAAYFGRTVAEVADSLVTWAVPMSDGEVLNVHQRMVPALRKVAAALEQAADLGWSYDIFRRQTFAYTPRTIGGNYRISQHSFGNAVDINSWSNPSTEGPLVTDMPGWFVNAWTDAGFCWGGDWVTKSDAMHFSWRGPIFGGGIGSLPDMYTPLTDPADFSDVIYRSVVSESARTSRVEVLVDVDGDSAIDVVSLLDRGASAVLEVASARTGYAQCPVTTIRIPGGVDGSVVIPGDWDGDGAVDLWAINDTDGVVVTPMLKADRFVPSEPVHLDVPRGDRYLAADFDVDGRSDLYILSAVDGGWSLAIRSGGDSFATVLARSFVPGHADTRFTVIDRDLDTVPDLVAIQQEKISIHDSASGLMTFGTSFPNVVEASDVAGTDFDGDGRHDLAVLTDGELTVYTGNTPLGTADVTSWFLSPDFECRAEPMRVSGR